MKTISKRFLKASLAMLLVVVMLLSSTITGFAAVVDKAQTKASQTFVAGEYVYFKNFKPSGWGENWFRSNRYGWIHIWNSSGSKDYKFELVSGTAGAVDAIYRAKIEDGGNYTNFIIAVSNSATDPWKDCYQTGDCEFSTSKFNYITKVTQNSKSYTGSYYAAAPQTAELSFASTHLGGSGTSDDPYLVEPGSDFKLKITATKSDPGMTGFGLSIGTSDPKGYSGTNSSYEETLTAPETANTKTEYKGYAWNYEYSTDYYSSSYTSSNSIYVKTIENNFKVDVATSDASLGTAEIIGSSEGSSTQGVNVKATPTKTGYEFTGWKVEPEYGGSFTNANEQLSETATFYPTDNVTLTATFALKKYDATFKYYENNVEKTTVVKDVEHGSEPVAPQVPKYDWRTGYEFTGWDPEVSAMTGDVTYTAQYTINTYTFVMATRVSTDGGETFVESTDGGTVVATDINGNALDNNKVPYGTKLKFTATPKSGYAFLKWVVDGKDSDVNTNELTTEEIKDNIKVEAVFVKTYTVTVSTDVGIEYLEVDGDHKYVNGESFTVNAGSSVSVYASPYTDFAFKEWSLTGDATIGTSLTTPRLTLTNIQSNITLTAVSQPLYDVTATAYTNGAASVTGGTATVSKDKAIKEEEVTFTATANPNYEFIGWYDDTDFTKPVENGTSKTLKYTLSAEPVTLYALFAKEYYYSVKEDNLENRIKFTYDAVKDEYSLTVPKISDVNSNPDYYGILENYDYSTTDKTKIGAEISAGQTTSTANFFTVANTTRTFYLRNSNTVAFDPTFITAKLEPGETQGTYVSRFYANPLNLKDVNLLIDGELSETYSFSVGATVSIKPEIPEDKYMLAPTFDPAIITGASVNENGEIIFTMPDDTATPYEEINVNVPLGQLYKISSDASVTGLVDTYSYHMAGSKNAEFLLQAADKYDVIANTVVVTKADGTVVSPKDYTVEKEGTSCKVIFNSMPNYDVMITADVSANFEVSCDIEVIDYIDTTDYDKFCSVEVIADGKLLDGNKGYVSNDKRVTFSANATSAGYREYTFLAYYDATTGALVSGNKDFVVEKASEDVKLKAVFYRNVYIIGEAAKGWETFVPMTFDYDSKKYTYDLDIDFGSFKISTVQDVDAGASFDYIMDRNTYSATGVTVNKKNSSGSLDLQGLSSNCTLPIKVTLEKTTNTTTPYKIDIKASPVAAKVYLSTGRKDYDPNFATGAFNTNSQFINYEGKYTMGKSGSAQRESYVSANIPNEKMTVEVQTTISGTKASLYDVAYYLVYDVDTATSTYVRATDRTNGVFSAQITVEGDTFICPIYYANQNYIDMIEENDGTAKSVEITLDLSDVADNDKVKWGPFVSAFIWGGEDVDNANSANIDFIGRFPGQLMIHTGNGIYKTRVIVSSTEDFRGVTFSNYMTTRNDGDNPDATVPGILIEDLGLTDYSIIQTYDYKEPVYLYKDGFDKITFKPMASELNNSANGEDVSAPTWTADRDYRQLTDYQGTPVDLYMNPIVEGTNSNTKKYYVIADNYWNCSTGEYTYDTSYQGQYSVKWWVYDQSGNCKTGILSGALFNRPTEGDNTALIQELTKPGTGITEADLKGAAVYIDYDGKSTGNGSDYNRIDGQWYGNKQTEQITASIKVALRDEYGTIVENTSETPNKADYGEAYIDKAGDKQPSHNYTAKDDADEYNMINVQVTAESKSIEGVNYRFVGYKVGDEIRKSGPIPIERNTEIIAVFEKVQEGTLYVTNKIYENPYDPEIISHGGQGMRYVSIYECSDDGTIIGEAISTDYDLDTAVASAPVTEGKHYKIVIKVVTSKPDYFYAWYMKDEGTYEEVLVTESNATTKEYEVEASFVYTYSKDMPLDIVIYSDIYEVSGKGKFIYTYRNRDNQERTITKEVKLTDAEIMGCPENGNTPYRPIYKKYTPMIKELADGTFDIQKAYSEVDILKYEADGYEVGGFESSAVLDNLPNVNVTEAFLYTITWKDDADHVKTSNDETSYIYVYADRDPQTFTVTATVDGETKYYIDQAYNTLIEDLEAPIKNKAGQTFSYWKDSKTNNIISYSRYYAYRIVDNRDIEAVYGVEVEDEWTPIIEEVDLTREYSDTGDYIYTDYLIAFHSRDKLEIQDLKDAGVEIEYGLTLVRQVDYNITSSSSVKYPNYDGILDDVRTTIENGKSTGFPKTDCKGYNIYRFEFTDEQTTNLNRIRHYIRYDNNNKNNYKSYAFSAYAYIIINGEIYISDSPTYVNFFELGNENKDENPAS